ncbi:hypothetical protein PoB_002005100 [Plakobranchus ocellatus]|uniref:Zasp-like motif domain-containing protein n=1 Tax=Plakobranchus ocellatus TaxID=259542 RepID=A0AAV3Z2K6_9GAST|nr:hypothetical protein PoB_002005100 [Plakobranchus ocellatus]
MYEEIVSLTSKTHNGYIRGLGKEPSTGPLVRVGRPQRTHGPILLNTITTGHRQLRVDQYEEINARQSNVYEVPVELVQHESASPNVDIMQQARANYSSLQQGTNSTKDNSYSNLGFGTGKEKCVYINTAGHDTDKGNP